LLLLVFTYGGAEDAMVPTGEVKQPRHTVPFALLAGLGVCMIVYTLVQFVTVATIGSTMTDRPLAQAASVLMNGGSIIVTIAVMISTYATFSGCVLNCPRLVCSLASQGDFPTFLGKLHPRFNTPARAIVLFAIVVWLLATSGTFLWAVVLAGGSTVLIYVGTSAALIRLRHQNPEAEALRIPFGRALAAVGVIIAVSLLTQLETRQALLMGVTALIAAANWWWAKRRDAQNRKISEVVVPLN
jgi:basic amino acid/polyamine antiporter, APA family